ncbi:hypothetical protein WDW37_08655 [Bdellovibrionota bacterium FG-1]
MASSKTMFFSVLSVIFLAFFSGALQAETALHDGAGPSLLVVGDSHTAGTFGQTLDIALRQIPDAQVATYGICGASPINYFSGRGTACGAYQHPIQGPARISQTASTPLLKTLLAQNHPTAVIVALGANLYRASVQEVRKQFDRMFGAIKEAGSSCFWIGPPSERFISAEKQEGFYGVFKDIAAQRDCALIDSREWTHYPEQGGDGIHYDGLFAVVQGKRVNIGVPIARDWANAVAQKITEALQKRNSSPEGFTAAGS